MSKDLLRARIENDFTYHAPKDDQVKRYEAIRNCAKAYALFLVEMVPESRELSLALTYIEQATFLANAGIARNK